MNTRVDESQNGSTLTNAMDATGSLVTNAVDAMVRWPMRMTGATMDVMLQGVQRMTGSNRGAGSSSYSAETSYQGSGYNTGSGVSSSSSTSSSSSSGPSWTSWMSGNADQDLSGDDLKYVIWSIVFTKPSFECVLEPQHEEIINYSADGNSFAAMKIAKFLEKARHGHSRKPETWGDAYPAESAKPRARREESTTVITTPGSTTVASSSGGSGAQTAGHERDKGWRIPTEDHKYITFLYRVDRRLPKQEEVTRVERVTVERGTRVV